MSLSRKMDSIPLDGIPHINGNEEIAAMCDNRWAAQVALVVKNPRATTGDLRDEGSISGLGRFPGGGHENPLQYPFLENPMDRGTWQATAHGIIRVGHNSATKSPPPYIG